MIEFLTLPNLYFRLYLFLFLMVGIGLSLTLIFKEGSDQEKPLEIVDLFLSPLIGFVVFIFIGYSTLRIFTLLGNARPFWQSLFILYLCTSLIFAGGIYFFLKKWRKFVWTDALSIAPVLTTFLIGIFSLLPMIIEQKATFFAGLGTDAFGYIRVAQSMLNGWYFQPIPELDLRDILFHPGRGWSYFMIVAQERPLIYYIVAIVSCMLNINPFQAYLLCGAIPSILFLNYLLFFAFSYHRRKIVKSFLLTLAFFLTTLTTFAGNFYHQFLGHIWAIVFLAALGPSIFLFRLGINNQRKFLPIFYFIFCFLSISIYDIRFTLIAFLALLVSFIFNSNWIKARLSIFWIFLSFIAAFAFAGNHSAILRNIFSPLETGGHFRANFSLQAFLMESCLASASSFSISIFLSLYFCLLIFTVTNLKNRTHSAPDNISEPFILLRTYNCLMMFGTLALVLFMLMKSSFWAADRILYLAIPFLIINLFFLLIKESKSRFNIKITILFFLIVINAYISIEKNISVARDIIGNDNSLLIKHDSLSSLSRELNLLKPQLVWFDGNMMTYLAFITYFQDSAWASLTDFNTWYHGGSIYPRFLFKVTIDPLKVYSTLLEMNEVKGAKNILLISMRNNSRRPIINYSRNYYIEPIDREKYPHGPIELKVKFTNHMAGKFEPLVVTGQTEAGDFVFVKYLENGEIVLGFDHWGAPTILSAPIRVFPDTAYDLEIHMGSLSPSITALWDSNIVSSRIGKTILIRINGLEVLKREAAFYPSAPNMVTIGENKIGGTSCGNLFSGKIISYRRIPATSENE